MMYMIFDELVMMVGCGEMTEADAEAIANAILNEKDKEWD